MTDNLAKSAAGNSTNTTIDELAIQRSDTNQDCDNRASLSTDLASSQRGLSSAVAGANLEEGNVRDAASLSSQWQVLFGLDRNTPDPIHIDISSLASQSGVSSMLIRDIAESIMSVSDLVIKMNRSIARSVRVDTRPVFRGVYESPLSAALADRRWSTIDWNAFGALDSSLETVATRLLTLFSSSSCEAGENLANQRRLTRLKRDFSNKLISMIREDEFDYGYDSRADVLVRQNMDQNSLATKSWLNDLFLAYFDDVPVAIGLLRIVAHLDYAEASPEGQTMAIAAFSHQNVEVRECGIRAFENWESTESLKVLQQLQVAPSWLQEYVDQVVSDLREQLSVSTR